MLSLAGKDLIRLAWNSLASDSDNKIRGNALDSWFATFLNVEYGSYVRDFLCKLDLLEYTSSGSGGYKPTFEL